VAFYRRLASLGRLILVDKRDTGLSDRAPRGLIGSLIRIPVTASNPIGAGAPFAPRFRDLRHTRAVKTALRTAASGHTPAKKVDRPSR
jgi:hypothetical protein